MLLAAGLIGRVDRVIKERSKGASWLAAAVRHRRD